MNPMEAAAPEQSGVDPVVTVVLLVVPVVVASTEPASAKSEVAAMVMTVDLIIRVSSYLKFAA